MNNVNKIVVFFCLVWGCVDAQTNVGNQNSDSLISLAQKYEAEGDFFNAIEYYKKAINDKDTSSFLYLKLAQLYSNQSDFSESIFWTEKRLLQDSNDVNALYFKILCLNNLEQYEKLIKTSDKYLKITKTNSDLVYHSRGIANFHFNNYEKAYSDLLKCLKVNPDFEKAYLPFGASAVELMSLREGRCFLLKSIEHRVKVPESYYYLGRSYLKENNYDKALYYYNLSANQFKVNSKDCDEFCTNVWLDLASLSIAIGKTSEAEKALEHIKSIRSDFSPQDFEDYIKLFITLEKYRDALEFNLEALTIFPNHYRFYGMNLYNHAKINGSFSQIFPYKQVKDIENCDANCQLISFIILSYELFDYSMALEGINLSYTKNIKSKLPQYIHLSMLRNDLGSNHLKVLELYDFLIDYLDYNYKKRALLKVMKATDLSSLNMTTQALKEINEAIELHEFAEYFIVKAFILINYYDNINPELKANIIELFDKAIELEPLNIEYFKIKALILKYFQLENEACEVAHKSQTINPKLGKLLHDYICFGMEPNDKDSISFSLEIEFDLTDFSIRFPGEFDE